MKLKQRPEDFRVEEFPAVTPSPPGAPGGPFAFYRLDKRGWTTPDALSALRRRWKVDFRRLSYGGLKDRHADTTQYLTIHNGPEKNLSHGGFTVTYLGRLAAAYSSEHIRANGFTVTLRSLSAQGVERAEAALPGVATVGVPNYFDDQRFGSVSFDNGFVAREMVLGNFEGALKLALAAPYEHDRGEAKREKAVLIARWGDWPTAKTELPRGHARSIVDYLVHHPTDFKGACARLRPELQGLYLSAWQSHLWNRMLDRWLRDRVPAEQLIPVRLKTGEVAMPRSIPEPVRPDWDDLTLPLPSARLKFDPNAPWAPVVTAVMAEEGIPLDQMRIKGMQQPFFSKGERIAKVPVSNLSWEAGDDELNKGRRKLTMRFELPRGAYATMIVKRLTTP
jgi:tRNA pseudouridine13 synthase